MHNDERENIFRETRRLFGIYIHRVIHHQNNFVFDDEKSCMKLKNMDLRYLTDEIFKRINQLDFIMKKIFTLQENTKEAVFINFVASTGYTPSKESQTDESDSSLRNVPSPFETKENQPEFQGLEQNVLEIEMLAEAFYYIAFRIRQATRNKDIPLPGLRNFECKGVRDVRNHLIEHVENSGILLQSFRYGNKQLGPQIKPLRPSDDKFHDQGLYFNAEEFCNNMNKLLVAEIKRVS